MPSCAQEERVKHAAISKLAEAALQPVPSDEISAYDGWMNEQPENLAISLITDMAAEKSMHNDAVEDDDENAPYEPSDTPTDLDIAIRANTINIETLFNAVGPRRQANAEAAAAAAVEALQHGPLWDPHGPQPLTSDALDEARTHVLATAAAQLRVAKTEPRSLGGPMWERSDMLPPQEPVVRACVECGLHTPRDTTTIIMIQQQQQ